MLVFKLLPDGGFVAGDTESRLTSYAYPTSTHANAAKRKPEATAREMVKNESRALHSFGVPRVVEYDAHNWQRLEA